MAGDAHEGRHRDAEQHTAWRAPPRPVDGEEEQRHPSQRREFAELPRDDPQIAGGGEDEGGARIEGRESSQAAAARPAVHGGAEQHQVERNLEVDPEGRRQHEMNQVDGVEEGGLEARQKGCARKEVGVPERQVSICQLLEPKCAQRVEGARRIARIARNHTAVRIEEHAGEQSKHEPRECRHGE